jgi:hypothetical protein
MMSNTLLEAQHYYVSRGKISFKKCLVKETWVQM